MPLPDGEAHLLTKDPGKGDFLSSLDSAGESNQGP